MKPKYAKAFRAELDIWTRRAKGESVEDSYPMCNRGKKYTCVKCPLDDERDNQ